jgi:mono/diheme cytochrome c family protein
MKKVVKIALCVLAAPVALAGAAVAVLALKPPAMRPASTEAIQATPERLARGEYLVHHVADCLGCHSDHDYERFAMPVKPGTEGMGGFPFDARFGVPGLVCAQNITSDKETGKGAWTDGEIMRAFREGVSKDGHALFPMMPYEYYRSMSDEDARAVTVFLRTLAPVHSPTPERRLAFPVNLLIKLAPAPLDHPIETPSDEKDHLGYGKYLTTLSGCMECHTPHDDKGQRVPGREGAGGWVLKGPWGTVVTANITPHPATFVGSATREQFVSRFKAFAGLTAATAPRTHPGSNTVMPWIAFGGMTEKDLGAIFDYLRTMPPIENKVEPFSQDPQPAVATKP